MGLLEYLPHFIYSTALTSVSMHHLFQRKAAEADRTHVAAQISILEDLHGRLAAREGNRESDRLQMSVRSHDVWCAEDGEEYLNST
ncbi:hypothetical protein C8T65DRAFT_753455 [Cerioporus squamosus]|nr:hypothetical protein C8T65DRAFT_753455 [Cerioporus squamosus]